MRQTIRLAHEWQVDDFRRFIGHRTRPVAIVIDSRSVAPPDCHSTGLQRPQRNNAACRVTLDERELPPAGKSLLERILAPIERRPFIVHRAIQDPRKIIGQLFRPASGITLVAHIGTTRFASGAKAEGAVNYQDYKIGAGFDLGSGFAAEAAFVGANKKDDWGDGNKSRFVLTLSKSL